MARPKFEDDPIGHLKFGMELTVDPASAPRPKKPVHPNSLAALEAHRKRTQLGGPGSKTCTHCNRVAVRGLDVCRFHGGAKTVAERKRKKGLPSGSRVKRAVQTIIRLMNEHKLPLELQTHPMFVAVWSERAKDMRARDKAELDYRRACSLLAYEIVLAWYAKEKGDWSPWAECVEKARRLNLVA